MCMRIQSLRRCSADAFYALAPSSGLLVSHLLIQPLSLLLNLPSNALLLSCVLLIRKEVEVCSNTHSFVFLPTFNAFPFSVFLTSRSQSCKGQRLSHLKWSACPSSRALQFVYQSQFILAHCLEISISLTNI